MAREFTAAEIESFRTAFDTFDEDKVGSISASSVAEMLEIMEKPFDTATLDNLMKELDVNNTGRLEFDEFVQLLAKLMN